MPDALAVLMRTTAHRHEVGGRTPSKLDRPQFSPPLCAGSQCRRLPPPYLAAILENLLNEMLLADTAVRNRGNFVPRRRPVFTITVTRIRWIVTTAALMRSIHSAMPVAVTRVIQLGG